jgi:FlaG/FlaF family flagellin (archaellin)
MTRSRERTEHAVSPVVGVMLMLVVTIIIAAVVSAFAGGITSETEKAPTAQIKASYSQSRGMTMENLGPDTINCQGVTVWTRLSESFGQAEHGTWQINKTFILNVKDVTKVGTFTTNTTPPSGAWWRFAGFSGVKTWSPGEVMYILPPYHLSNNTQVGMTSYTSYAYNFTGSLGKEFWLELKTTDGKVFAKTKVRIEP